MEKSKEIVEFWFGPLSDGGWGFERERLSYWFNGGEAVDRELRERFAADVEAAAAGAYDAWPETPIGRMALILLLDQMPRNIYRGTPKAWELDPRAQAVVLEGLERGHDRALAPIQRSFFYLPLEHAENAALQARSVELYTALATEAPPAWKENYESFLDYAVRHKVIIDRFGHFPHRNGILGRKSTPEEEAFLLTPGSSF